MNQELFGTRVDEPLIREITIKTFNPFLKIPEQIELEDKQKTITSNKKNNSEHQTPKSKLSKEDKRTKETKNEYSNNVNQPSALKNGNVDKVGSDSLQKEDLKSTSDRDSKQKRKRENDQEMEKEDKLNQKSKPEKKGISNSHSSMNGSANSFPKPLNPLFNKKEFTFLKTSNEDSGSFDPNSQIYQFANLINSKQSITKPTNPDSILKLLNSNDYEKEDEEINENYEEMEEESVKNSESNNDDELNKTNLDNNYPYFKMVCLTFENLKEDGKDGIGYGIVSIERKKERMQDTRSNKKNLKRESENGSKTEKSLDFKVEKPKEGFKIDCPLLIIKTKVKSVLRIYQIVGNASKIVYLGNNKSAVSLFVYRIEQDFELKEKLVRYNLKIKFHNENEARKFTECFEMFC